MQQIILPGQQRPALSGTTASLGGRTFLSVVAVFFVLMLVLPTTFQLYRGAFLAALVLAASIAAISGWRLHRDIFMLLLASLLVGCGGIFWGVLNNAPGALRVSTVYLLWPLVYALFIGLVHSLSVIRTLQSALIVGIAISTVMSLLVLLSGFLGYGGVVFPLLSFLDAGFGHYDGFTEFRIYNLTTVMYGFPFVFALLLSGRTEQSALMKAFLWILLFAILIVAIGSGRRMFLLLVILTPFITLFFLQGSAARLKTLKVFSVFVATSVFGIGGLTLAIQLLGLQPAVIANQFMAAFLGQEASSGIRYEQAAALWRAFLSSPLIGIGLGSTVDSIYRQGWAFELWYLSLLKSVGLIGILVYLAAVVWTVVKGWRIARRDREFAVLFVPAVTAMVGFLAMTATNPYLGKFDYLWVIFFPVALINAYLTRRSEHA